MSRRHGAHLPYDQTPSQPKRPSPVNLPRNLLEVVGNLLCLKMDKDTHSITATLGV